MTFLNPNILWALAGVAVPVLIHLLHRRRAADIDWGAMRFLLAGVARHSRRVRVEALLLLAARCGLIALVVLAVARPFFRDRQIVGQTDQPRDMAIVIDASLSMTVSVEGRTNFQRAIDEARSVLAACRPGDAVSLVLAGPTVRTVVAKPTSDLAAVAEALGRLTPTAGAMRPLEAMETAAAALGEGHNTVKRIVVITDGHAAGWDPAAARRWRYLAEGLDELATEPIIIVRTLGVPDEWANLAVGRLRTDRKIIGTDRAMTLSARIVNTGLQPLAPGEVQLRIDGVAHPPTMAAEPIAPGGAETITFDHTFTTPGPHLLIVRLATEDDLPGDNQAACVVDVREKLDVLIADGAPSSRPLAGQGDFLRIALTRSAAADRPALIAAKVVDAADLAAEETFTPYAAVMLANVPALPKAVAARLAEYVHAGGGLMVAPGGLVQPAFYNSWADPNGAALLPARFAGTVDDTANDDGTGRPAAGGADVFAKALGADAYDFARLAVRRHWRLRPAADAEVAAALESGDPLLALRAAGQGRVALLAIPADDDWTNLAGLDCLTPLAHELTYYLAGDRDAPPALLPGQRWLYSLPDSAEAGGEYLVVTPDGRRVRQTVRHTDSGPRIAFDQTYTPGLYRLIGPDGGDGGPFVVSGDAEESVLTLLTDADLADLAEYADVRHAATADQLVTAVSGQTPGVEIWRLLVAIAATVAGMEVLLARRIAARRRMHRPGGVEFAAGQESPELDTMQRRLARPSRS